MIRHLMAAGALATAFAGPVQAQALSVPAGALGPALTAIGGQAGVQIIAPSTLVAGQQTAGASGLADVEAALAAALSGTGLTWRMVGPGSYAIVRPDQRAETGDVTVLDPIIVQGATGLRATGAMTATRTDTPLRDIPQTVAVVGREEIEQRQVTSLTAALEGVPSLTEQSTSANRGESYLLRGFEADAYAIDGTVANAASDRPEVMADLASVERVEVLKGPASVLYGRGSPGGIINLVTRQPDPVPGGSVTLQGGSYGFARAEGTATGALNAAGTLSGRITGAAQTEDGFLNGRPKSERQFAGGSLAWEPTDTTRLTFGLDYTHMKQPFDRGVPLMPDGEVLEPYDTWLGEEWSMIDARKTRATLGAEHDLNAAVTLRGWLSYDNAFVHDTGIDNRGVEGTTLSRRYTDRTEDTSNLDARLEAELRFATGTVDHTVLTGVEFTDGRMEFDSGRANIAPIDVYDPVHGAARPPVTPNASYDERVLARSAYVQDQITFSPQWKALVGLRYDTYDTTNANHFDDELTKVGEEAVTGRVGLVWQPRDDLSLYASWAQSFQPQSGTDRNRDPLDAEEGEQFEIGAKWDIRPDLTATISAYQITKTNVATSDPFDSDFSILTGEQRVRGIEADLIGNVTDAWAIRASAGVLHSEVTRDETEIEGNRLAGVANVTASLWTTYTLPSDITLGAGIVHVGDRKGDLDNSFEVESYTRLDTMAAFPVSDRAEISVMIRNVTDEDYIATTAGENENDPGAPRSVMAKLDYRF
ncbi:TonB-dependent siderophore receptor [Falsirhodobacter sp. 20TX0035]|uniref:TonB-dependent siderophore receptor n=1 Tax=Falsirhodobacter sp. 20TX0035 TaxID=3022019 RepID=UPI00233010DA|nr:TonB-dependent receptor [Falsirhodobacter sp. 20TX0035]MDB6454261.1 TonB-dependent receptor [Falsirhodobacter sp. 20TX0035]